MNIIVTILCSFNLLFAEILQECNLNLNDIITPVRVEVLEQLLTDTDFEKKECEFVV